MKLSSKKELQAHRINSACLTTNSNSNYLSGIESLKRELDIKECMIAQLLSTMKEIPTVNITQNVKHMPVFTCENETIGNNISGIKSTQSKKGKSVDVIFSNGNIETNSQTKNS